MRSLVLGGNGFIGRHLADRLTKLGHEVTVVDLLENPYPGTAKVNFIRGDLRRTETFQMLPQNGFDWVFQLAADMGGAGYVFTGDHDADIMHNSAMINLNVVEHFKHSNAVLLYASSACIYPEENQTDPLNPNCSEHTAYPANPDSEYGWEKLFSERLYAAYHRNHGLAVRIARFHNVYGPRTAFRGGREKAPAALCRKVAELGEEGKVEVWGTGEQTRSFLYIDDCIDAILLLMESQYSEPVNIGSEEMVSIAELCRRIIRLSGKKLSLQFIEGPVGVNGRCSDNKIVRSVLHWGPSVPLNEGLKHLYLWIREQIHT